MAEVQPAFTVIPEPEGRMPAVLTEMNSVRCSRRWCARRRLGWGPHARTGSAPGRCSQVAARQSAGMARVAAEALVGELDAMICVAGTAGGQCEFLGGVPIESTFGRVGGRAWGCPGSCRP